MSPAASHILDFNDLRRITGHERPSDVSRCLRRQGVYVFDGRNGPYTTLELLNAAGGFMMQAPNETESL